MSYFVLQNEAVKKNCLDHVYSLPVGQNWGVEILTKEQTRTLQQNKLYWKWVGIIGNEIGNEKNEQHNQFSLKHLGADFIEYKGDVYLRVKSTTDLNVKKFSKYLGDVEAEAINLGIRLPQPSYYGYDLIKVTK